MGRRNRGLLRTTLYLDPGSIERINNADPEKRATSVHVREALDLYAEYLELVQTTEQTAKETVK